MSAKPLLRQKKSATAEQSKFRVSIIAKKPGSALWNLASQVSISTTPKRPGKRHGIRPMITGVADLLARPGTAIVYTVNDAKSNGPADEYLCKPGDVICCYQVKRSQA